MKYIKSILVGGGLAMMMVGVSRMANGLPYGIILLIVGACLFSITQ